MYTQNRLSSLFVHVKPMNENIIKVSYTHSKEEPANGSIQVLS